MHQRNEMRNTPCRILTLVNRIFSNEAAPPVMRKCLVAPPPSTVTRHRLSPERHVPPLINTGRGTLTKAVNVTSCISSTVSTHESLMAVCSSEKVLTRRIRPGEPALADANRRVNIANPCLPRCDGLKCRVSQLR